MSAGGGEALVWGVALVAIVLLPLASLLIAAVGREISEDLERGLPTPNGTRKRRGGRQIS